MAAGRRLAVSGALGALGLSAVVGCGRHEPDALETARAAVTTEGLESKGFCVPPGLRPGRDWIDEMCDTPSVPPALGAVSVRLWMANRDGVVGHGSYRADQPVPLDLIITNQVDRDIVLAGMSLHRMIHRLEIIDPDGDRVLAGGGAPAPEPGPPPVVLACGRLLQLTPVQPLRASCEAVELLPDLRELYNLSKPGTYRVRLYMDYASYPRVFTNRDGQPMARLDEYQGARTISSNTLQFTVDPD